MLRHSLTYFQFCDCRIEVQVMGARIWIPSQDRGLPLIFSVGLGIFHVTYNFQCRLNTGRINMNALETEMA